MVKLLIRPAPPTGPGPVSTSGQVAARHEASLSEGHTRGHQPQPSTFRLRWRSSQSFRRLSAQLDGIRYAEERADLPLGRPLMIVEGVDPRDTQWEVDWPVYRVYFWHQPPAPPGVAQEQVMWHCDEYRLSEVT